MSKRWKSGDPIKFADEPAIEANKRPKRSCRSDGNKTTPVTSRSVSSAARRPALKVLRNRVLDQSHSTETPAQSPSVASAICEAGGGKDSGLRRQIEIAEDPSFRGTWKFDSPSQDSQPAQVPLTTAIMRHQDVLQNLHGKPRTRPTGPLDWSSPSSLSSIAPDSPLPVVRPQSTNGFATSPLVHMASPSSSAYDVSVYSESVDSTGCKVDASSPHPERDIMACDDDQSLNQADIRDPPESVMPATAGDDGETQTPITWTARAARQNQHAEGISDQSHDDSRESFKDALEHLPEDEADDDMSDTDYECSLEDDILLGLNLDATSLIPFPRFGGLAASNDEGYSHKPLTSTPKPLIQTACPVPQTSATQHSVRHMGPPGSSQRSWGSFWGATRPSSSSMPFLFPNLPNLPVREGVQRSLSNTTVSAEYTGSLSTSMSLAPSSVSVKPKPKPKPTAAEKRQKSALKKIADAKRQKELAALHKKFDYTEYTVASGDGHESQPNLVVVEREEDVQAWCARLEGPLGFDMEWTFRFVKTKTKDGEDKTIIIKDPTGLVQLGDKRNIVLIHLARMKTFPVALQELMEDPTIYKLGVNIVGDGDKLLDDFGVQSKGLVELTKLSRQVDTNASTRTLVRLQELTATYLARYLEKGDDRISNWNQILTSSQKFYAANDVYVAIKMLERFEELAKKAGKTVDLSAAQVKVKEGSSAVTQTNPVGVQAALAGGSVPAKPAPSAPPPGRGACRGKGPTPRLVEAWTFWRRGLNAEEIAARMNNIQPRTAIGYVVKCVVQGQGQYAYDKEALIEFSKDGHPNNEKMLTEFFENE